jgi:hypothetical protein
LPLSLFSLALLPSLSPKGERGPKRENCKEKRGLREGQRGKRAREKRDPTPYPGQISFPLPLPHLLLQKAVLSLRINIRISKSFL